MIVSFYRCDGCKNITENFYAEKGWIHLESPASISITVAKGFYGKAAYETFYKIDIKDFCSWDCFKNFVMKEKE
jgi:hypothetical protein